MIYSEKNIKVYFNKQDMKTIDNPNKEDGSIEE